MVALAFPSNSRGRSWILWTYQRVIDRARGQGGQQVLNFVHFSRIESGWGMKRTNPRAEASTPRRTVYLYGKRTSCPGGCAFDISLYNTGWMRRGSAPPAVYAHHASTQPRVQERDQPALVPCNTVGKAQVCLGGYGPSYVYEASHVLSEGLVEKLTPTTRDHQIPLSSTIEYMEAPSRATRSMELDPIHTW
jgi:hypothetical protein